MGRIVTRPKTSEILWFSSDWWERNGQLTLFDQDLQSKMLKDMKAESAPDNGPNGVVQAFDDATRETFIEIVQELVPPVAQRFRELDQLGQARRLGLIQPGAQEPFGAGPVVNFVGERAKLLFQHIRLAQFGEGRQDGLEFGFFFGFQFGAVS